MSSVLVFPGSARLPIKRARGGSVGVSKVTDLIARVHYDHQVITGFRATTTGRVKMRLPVGILPFWARYAYRPHPFAGFDPFATTPERYGDRWDESSYYSSSPSSSSTDLSDLDPLPTEALTSRGDVFSEEPFLPPGPMDEEAFEEDGDGKLFASVTGWALDSFTMDSSVVIQRIGSNTGTITTRSVTASAGEMPNAGRVNVINHFPSSIDTTDEYAHIGHADLHDFVYVDLSVSMTSGNATSGGFIGLFTGDVVLRATNYGAWFSEREPET